jgi:hypothetical protein
MVSRSFRLNIGLAVVAALAIMAAGVALLTRDAQANHADDPVEVQILHSGSCTAAATPTCTGQAATDLTLAVGAQFTVQANATVNAPVGNGQQWMFVWQGPVLDLVGTPVNLDTDHTSCAAPFAPAGLTAGTEGIAGGCAAGTTDDGPIVDLTLQCATDGVTQVGLAGLDLDENFGTVLDVFLTTTTTLEDIYPNTSQLGGTAGTPANIASFLVTCGSPGPTATPQPATATATATATIPPPPTATPCQTNCPTTFPNPFTRTPTPEPTGSPTVAPPGGETPAPGGPGTPAPGGGTPGGGTGPGGIRPPDTGTGGGAASSNTLVALVILLAAGASASLAGGIWYLRRQA